MNLCTDQLALMLAAPGQLISVSAMAQDPRASVMAAQAAALPANHGLAEEIFLMQPDLVLAGSFSTPATVALLRRLGTPVEVFAPENDLDDLRASILRMGAVLGREAQASALVARFDADLAALSAPLPGDPPSAAMYAANGYSSGPDSLAGAIIGAAGFDQLGETLGLGIGGVVPLEVLMLARPDLLITGQPYPGASRAEEVLDHPGIRALRALGPSQVTVNRDWVCGTPHVLRAVAGLRALREAM